MGDVPHGCIRGTMQRLLIVATVAAVATLVAGNSCAVHNPAPCRFITTYDNGNNVKASTCHNLCWNVHGDDGHWCIKAGTQQCVCFYDNDCGCPARSSVEWDCTKSVVDGQEQPRKRDAGK